MRRKYKFYKNPIKWYVNVVKNSIEPTNPSHKIMMNVEIQKGKTEGRALIPCTIYTMEHSIDANPSLIRKKDKKIIKKLPVKKKINYDSNKYKVELTKEEKELGYELNEIERCSHCGSKIVIAEIAETRYRSCPDVKVRVSDKAKENLVIPIEFGIRKSQVYIWLIIPLIFDLLFIFLSLDFLFGVDFLNNLGEKITHSLPIFILIPLSILFGLYILHFIVLIHYKPYKLWTWYSKVKPTLKKVKNYKHRG